MKKLRQNLLLAVLCGLIGSSFTGYKAYGQNKKSQGALQPVQGLTVFDAKGQRIGTVLGFGSASGSFPTIAFRVEGRLVILNVEQHKIRGGEFTREVSSFYFESPNCTGPAFGSPGTPDATVAPIQVLDGTKLYVVDGPPTTIFVRSQGSTSSPSNPCVTIDPPFQTVGKPVRFLIDLADHFQPPFTLR